MIKSTLERRGPVPLPPFQGVREYMVPFYPEDGLPERLLVWQDTVDAMLDGIRVPGRVYLMIDQQRVRAGSTHRRPGLHCDGHWIEDTRSHIPPGGRHGEPTRAYPEAILLAASHAGCMGFKGYYDETLLLPGNDARQLAVAALEMDSVLMSAGFCWAGNAAMLHLPIPHAEDVERTVVRLNVPGWAPQ